MRLILLPALAIFILEFLIFTNATKLICSEPAEGDFVLGEDGEKGTSLIKEKCDDMKNGTLIRWKKGAKVSENCDCIPSMTAIATFTGPPLSPFNPDKRNQHAAIFVRCDPDGNGLVVYDQWPGHRVRRRTIKFGESYKYPMHDASMYYAIEV